MQKQTLAVALMVCAALFMSFTTVNCVGLRMRQNTTAPVYRYPNGTVVPDDQLEGLLNDPNTKVDNKNATQPAAPAKNTTAAKPVAATPSKTTPTKKPVVAAAPAKNTTAAPANATKGGYTYPNGTAIPADELEKLLKDPNTKVDNKTSNATAPAKNTTAPSKNTTAPAKNTTAPAKNTTAPAKNTTAPAKNETAPVYRYPNGTIVPADKLDGLLNDPNTTVTDKDGKPVPNKNATKPAPAANTTKPAAQNQTQGNNNNNNGNTIYKYPNGTVVPQDQVAGLLGNQQNNNNGATTGNNNGATTGNNNNNGNTYTNLGDFLNSLNGGRGNTNTGAQQPVLPFPTTTTLSNAQVQQLFNNLNIAH